MSEPKFLDELKFDANGLIPVVIQDANTGEVLTVAYMNRDAVRLTFETGKTWFWRRRHQKLMMKGEHSGRVQVVKEILVDCDADALVVKVEQVGGAACHEGYPSCFFRKVTKDGELEVFQQRVFDPNEVYGEKGGG
ncbi:phosphoribosyl-AMP cyclohydrolase [Fervidibacter sacchari]|uniref:Phosphoribosyl-AMP cyclohydrolase n=1 Tax=Candidatus Fervidibacter sacchari TaxID=1448929 RepID=A0ABT2ESI3_9BACT|nr:phosphoribosyl-AMP cyclohydrolase [Candidatus Fervidibacter sacchari]MCS3920820.1 phosphoribosyl-AMP cyclohydrolase [Candidatus Fervidibacter sacchari]WKU17846.1 phosphoribosyl-AMP cyclohydrolase [Candidatus Fervidibacter sacchari]